MEEQNKSAFKSKGMFNQANPLLFALAKDLRKNMTSAEMVLWGYLKSGISGLKFRRQHPLGLYIADFYCHRLKLIIEVDGSIHNNTDVKTHDMGRENSLVNEGYKVIRFSNHQVLKETETVLEEIHLLVETLVNNYKI